METMEPMVSLELMELTETRDHLVSLDLSDPTDLLVVPVMTDSLEDQ